MIDWEFSKENCIFVYVPINHAITKSPVLIKFLLDTGAGWSSISHKNLVSLGYTQEDIQRSWRMGNTGLANNEIVVGYGLDLGVASFFGEVVPKNLLYRFLTKSKDKLGNIGGFGTLLGMDILSCFDITISNSKGTLQFDLIESLEYRNKIYHHTYVMGSNPVSQSNAIRGIKQLSTFTRINQS